MSGVVAPKGGKFLIEVVNTSSKTAKLQKGHVLGCLIQMEEAQICSTTAKVKIEDPAMARLNRLATQDGKAPIPDFEATPKLPKLNLPWKMTHTDTWQLMMQMCGIHLQKSPT